MIILREAQEKDIPWLEKLAQIPGFINLPSDPDLLREKIEFSQKAFLEEADSPDENKFMFVAEDTTTGRVLATSMVAAQHGSPALPHFYFEVGHEEKFSKTINTGFIHGTLKLKYDSNGPSEIGGLVLDPGWRKGDERLGTQMSFVRFLFIGLHRSLFKKKILAELLPPLNKKGQSPLWEAIGRRFTNMDYWEADRLCSKDKEFILSLFPEGKIYTSFLTAEARNAIGKVGKDTEPVIHMLKKIGFDYKNQIDPFDGGPHFWAETEKIVPIQKIKKAVFRSSGSTLQTGFEGLMTLEKQVKGTFLAVKVSADSVSKPTLFWHQDLKGLESRFKLKEGDSVNFMPLS